MKKVIAVIFAISIILGLPTVVLADSYTGDAPFGDIADHKYQTAIEFCSELGIVVGDESGNFNPDKKITEAEFYKVVALATDPTMREVENYENVEYRGPEKYEWAKKYCGYVLDRLFIYEDYEKNSQTQKLAAVIHEDPFSNVSSSWAGRIMANALGYHAPLYYGLKDDEKIGIFKGVDIEESKMNYLTRGEVAQMIYNFLGAQKVFTDKSGKVTPLVYQVPAKFIHNHSSWEQIVFSNNKI